MKDGTCLIPVSALKPSASLAVNRRQTSFAISLAISRAICRQPLAVPFHVHDRSHQTGTHFREEYIGKTIKGK
jgi:hypothetical protein